MTPPSIDVLYIGGYGRSGSTLLHRLLGTAEGHFPTGEASRIWSYHLLHNQPCGCGRPFRECAFWMAVMDEAFGGIDCVDARHVMALRKATLGNWPRLVFRRLRTETYERQLQEYGAIVERLYHAIQQVSGCQVIVDSSKSTAYALMLTGIPSIRLSMVELIRDSRACAFSWQRRKERIDALDKAMMMDRQSLPRSAVEWSLRLSTLPLVSRRAAVHVTCRYEDFAEEPRQTLAAIAAELGIADPASFPFCSDQSVVLKSDHFLWGNPDRLRKGAITIRLDDEWRRAMGWKQRAIVTALTFPLLWKYGYLNSATGISRTRADDRRSGAT
jgi:hypothetical protein